MELTQSITALSGKIILNFNFKLSNFLEKQKSDFRRMQDIYTGCQTESAEKPGLSYE